MQKALLLIALTAWIALVGAEQPKLLWSFEANASIKSVTISHTGDYVGLVSGNKIYLLNKTGAVVLENETEDKALSVALTPEGNVAAGDGSSLYLFDKNGKLIFQSFVGDSVNDISVSPEAVAVGSSDRNVRLYNNTGSMLWSYTADSSVRGVGIGGNRILAGTSAGRLFALDTGGELLWEQELHRYIADVAVSGETSAVGSSKLVQFFRGKEFVWEHTAEDEITGVAISPEGDYAAASTENGKIYYLNTKGRKLWDYKFNASARGIALSSHGERIVTAAGSTLYVLAPPDITPPKITIISPKQEDKVSGIVEIKAELDKPSSVAIYIDGNYACSLPCRWDTSASSQGRHTITIRAADASGNAAEARVEVELDRKKVEVPEANLTNIEEKAKNLTQNLTGAVKNIGSQNYSGAAKNASGELKTELKRVWWSSSFRDLGAKILVAGSVLAVLATYFKLRKKPGKQFRWKGR